jgi:hypothetical protein
MGKGIWALGVSREAGEVWVRPPLSLPKKELPEPPGGTVEVGDGRTSCRREGGSFLSLFQIAELQEMAPAPGCDRPRTLAQPATPASVAGVAGWELVGDMETLAKDPFL